MNWHKIRGKFIIKLSAKHQHHMTNSGSKIIQENSHENTQSIRIKREINTYQFCQFSTCKNITKTVTNISRSHSNFLGFLCKKYKDEQGVQAAGIEVYIAISSKKKHKKTQGPRLQSPNPPSLVDPDLQNASEALDQSGSSST